MGNVKRLVPSIPSGLMPLFKSDLGIIQDNLYNVLLALCAANDPGYSFILSGMTYSVSSGNAVISAGYWWKRDTNEVIYFPGGAAAGLSCYVSKTTSVFSTKTYKDGSTQNVYVETVSNLSSATLSPNPPLNAIQYTATGTLQDFKQIVKTWANKNSAWTNVTFTNSWGHNGVQYVQYRKNTNGKTILRGRALHSGASAASIATLPIGFRPTRDFLAVASNGSASILVLIGADGTIVPPSGTDVYLDGVEFDND